LIGIPRGSKTTRRVSGFTGSAASSGETVEQYNAKAAQGTMLKRVSTA
jgi:hypothetical protein